MVTGSSPRWYKDWLAWVLIVPLVYGFISLLSLASDIGRPFPGFLTYYNTLANKIDIEWNVPAWWWGTSDDLPRVGDQIVSVAGVPFESVNSVPSEAALYQAAWDSGQREISMVIRRGAEMESIIVPLEQFSWTHYLDLLIVPFIASLCYWLVAFILYRAIGSRQRSEERAIVFVFAMFSIVGFAVEPGLFALTEGWRQILVFTNPLFFGVFAIGGALLIHLALVLPVMRWPRFTQVIMPVLYLVGLVLLAGYIASVLIVLWWGGNEWSVWLNGRWFDNYQRFIGVGILVFMGRLFVEPWLWPKKSRERREMFFLLAAFGLFVPFVFFAVPSLDDYLDSFSWFPLLADPRFLSLSLPLAWAAIRLRYQTFTQGQTLLLVALMVAVSGFMANLGVALLFWQVPELVRGLPFPPTAVLFLLFFTLSLLWGWQSSWRGWLGRILHWERISYNQALTYGQTLAATAHADEQTLAQAMADELVSALGVRHTAVYLPRPSDKTLTLAATAGEQTDSLPSSLSLPTTTLQRPVRLPSPALPTVPSLTLLLPLVSDGQLVGVLGLSERWDTAVFDDRDLEILDLIAQQSAIFLQNTRQTSRLRQADQQLIQMQEETQRKTAQDLHDYVLPALSQLQLQLHTAQRLLSAEPDEATAQLSESLARLKENTAVVRRIQKDLGTRPLEYGLTPYLQEMVQRFTQETGLPVTVQWLDDLDTRLPDVVARRALHGVWQEALNNIQRHAQASHVTITLRPENGGLAFAIIDDGLGSSEDQRHHARASSHFGLRSMQARLESVGGTFAFDSQPGHGSTVRGWLPSKKG